MKDGSQAARCVDVDAVSDSIVRCEPSHQTYALEIGASVDALEVQAFDADGRLVPYVHRDQPIQPTPSSILIVDDALRGGLIVSGCPSGASNCSAEITFLVAAARCTARLVVFDPTTAGTAVLVRANGAAIAAQRVEFLVNGQTQEAFTNNDGVARISAKASAVMVRRNGFRAEVRAGRDLRGVIVDIYPLKTPVVPLTISTRPSSDGWFALAGNAASENALPLVLDLLSGDRLFTSTQTGVSDLSLPRDFAQTSHSWEADSTVLLDGGRVSWGLITDFVPIESTVLTGLSQGASRSGAFISSLFVGHGVRYSHDAGVINCDSAVETLSQQPVPAEILCGTDQDRCSGGVIATSWLDSRSAGLVLSGFVVGDATQPLERKASAPHDGLEGAHELRLLTAVSGDRRAEATMVVRDTSPLSASPPTISHVSTLACDDCDLLTARARALNVLSDSGSVREALSLIRSRLPEPAFHQIIAIRLSPGVNIDRALALGEILPNADTWSALSE